MRYHSRKMYKILVHFAVKTPSLVREGPDQGSLSRIHDCKNICDKNDWVCIKNQSFCIKVCNKILVFVKNIVNFHNSFVNLQFIIWFFNKNTKYDLPCHSTAGSIFQSLWNRHAPKSAGSLLGAAYSSCTQGASACNTYRVAPCGEWRPQTTRAHWTSVCTSLTSFILYSHARNHVAKLNSVLDIVVSCKWRVSSSRYQYLRYRNVPGIWAH